MLNFLQLYKQKLSLYRINITWGIIPSLLILFNFCSDQITFSPSCPRSMSTVGKSHFPVYSPSMCINLQIKKRPEQLTWCERYNMLISRRTKIKSTWRERSWSPIKGVIKMTATDENNHDHVTTSDLIVRDHKQKKLIPKESKTLL